MKKNKTRSKFMLNAPPAIFLIFMAISFFAIIYLSSCTLNLDGAGNKSITLPVEDAEFLSHLIRGDK